LRILLDTQLFLWLVLGSPKLKRSTRKMIEEATAVYVSAASIWEIAVKASLGKLDVDPALIIDELDSGGLIELPILAQHAARVARLPRIHGDPFDRLLIAQALYEPLTLLTSDAALSAYGPAIVVAS
jgi:PIN domain nuclease of toxin-antitoxin system